MKKCKFYILSGLISVLFFFSSCEDDLNELPPSTLIAENAIVNQTSAEVALNGVYSYLGANGELVVYQIVDNAVRCYFIEPNIGTLRSNFELDLLSWNAVEDVYATIKNRWVVSFRMIDASNNFISRVEALPDDMFAEGKKTEMLAEAYFVRAWANLYLMKMFSHFWDIESEYGPLLRLEPAGLSNNHMARSSVKAGYDQIISDLEYAAEYGPDFYSVYRASHGLAKAYLVETLLMRGSEGDFARAAILADDVIENSGFTLSATFDGIYTQKWNTPELMFSRSVFDIDPAELGGMRPTIYSLLAVGGRNNPTDNYMSFFQPDDPRREVILGDVITETATYENSWLKHFEPDSDVPVRYMRLSQMYIYKAEALARSNASASAVLEPINILMVRAGLDPYPTNVNYSLPELLEIIFSELVVEVGVENGSEYYAAVRYLDASGNRFIKTLNDAFTDDRRLALPIPADEIMFNPLMVQNPY